MPLDFVVGTGTEDEPDMITVDHHRMIATQIALQSARTVAAVTS